MVNLRDVSSITNRFLQIKDSRAVDTGRIFGLPSNVEESNERLLTPTILDEGRIAKVARRMVLEKDEKFEKFCFAQAFEPYHVRLAPKLAINFNLPQNAALFFDLAQWNL